jgi:hypothetical protein
MAFGARTEGVSVRSREDKRERTGWQMDLYARDLQM